MKFVFLTPILITTLTFSLWAQSGSSATIKAAAKNTHQESRSTERDTSDRNFSWIALHTRLMLASPNYTFNQVPVLDYGYSDFRTANIGGSVKLQLLNFLYGEYALFSNLYSQRTNLMVAGIETPSKGVRLGLRYRWGNDGITPAFGEVNRDLQAYINLGGAKGGLEIALGGIESMIDTPAGSLMESLSLTNVQVRLNIPIWSSN